MQKIPVSTDANQTFKTRLDSQTVSVDLRWQDVGEAWFISVSNADDDIIYVQNKRLNANIFILAQFPLRGFKGGIIAISEKDISDELVRNSFQENFNLYFVTASELNELRKF